MLSIQPIVDAVTAGNCVILKPSEISPNVSDILKKLIEKTFERGHVDVILGDKEDCSFLLDQDFDYIFFTGSTRVGKILRRKNGKEIFYHKFYFICHAYCSRYKLYCRRRAFT